MEEKGDAPGKQEDDAARKLVGREGPLVLDGLLIHLHRGAGLPATQADAAVFRRMEQERAAAQLHGPERLANGLARMREAGLQAGEPDARALLEIQQAAPLADPPGLRVRKDGQTGEPQGGDGLPCAMGLRIREQMLAPGLVMMRGHGRSLAQDSPNVPWILYVLQVLAYCPGE